MVLIPDYYRGVSFDPTTKARHITLQFLTDQSKWSNNGQLFQDYSIVKSYAKENLGCKTFGTIGTCWGTYAVLRMSEDVDIKAAVSMHPSHPSVLGLYFTTECSEQFTEMSRNLSIMAIFLKHNEPFLLSLKLSLEKRKRLV